MNDRETPQYTASDYITAILATLNHYDRPAVPVSLTHTKGSKKSKWEAKDLVTHVAYLKGARVPLDIAVLEVRLLEPYIRLLMS
jgi:hypothetical protein